MNKLERLKEHKRLKVSNSDEYQVTIYSSITLEDILTILHSIKNGYRFDIEKVVKMWVWNKPLEQQPQETIDFLYDLIYKNDQTT